MRKNTQCKKWILTTLLCVVLTAVLLSGCGESDSKADKQTGEPIQSTEELAETTENEEVDQGIKYDSSAFLKTVPEWDGFAFAYVNENKPNFQEDEIWSTVQESLDQLDQLGRCGTASSCIGQEGMPTEPRGDISSVEPTGWHSDNYDFIDGESLYNRCHLIGHQLSGDDAIPRNLITGTSYMNHEGMLPFENAIASYVKETGNHVMYRVTPIFAEDELVARGVHMEAISVEDDGDGLTFNVFCYNVQPGVDIDYSTGDNRLSEDKTMLEDYTAGKFSMIANTQGAVGAAGSEEITRSIPNNEESQETLYVINTNTGRFHYPDCNSVSDMAEHNKQEEKTTRDELIERGFKPCGNCKP